MSLQLLREFLQARDEQPLPDKVEHFLSKTETDAKACMLKGTAFLVECASPDVAEVIATREPTRSFCICAGEKNLVVKTEAEDPFRKALHRLGYGMPHG